MDTLRSFSLMLLGALGGVVLLAVALVVVLVW